MNNGETGEKESGEVAVSKNTSWPCGVPCWIIYAMLMLFSIRTDDFFISPFFFNCKM